MAAEESNLKQRKAALRAEAKSRCAALADEARSVLGRRILARILELPETQAARTVFCFVSHGDEVDTHALIDHLLQSGKRVVIPRILPERRMIAVPFPGWKELVPGTLGIPAPAGDAAFEGTVDLCITPGLAFTVDGGRLGHGRGYYDRWLAEHAPIITVAPAFECQVVRELPMAAHDVRIDMVATEDRLLLCTRH